MQTTKIKLSKEQEVTLVSKGIVRIYRTTYVDTLRKGQAFFIKITKVGRKYLYGTHIFFDVDGRHDREWEHKFLMEDYIIYDGLRNDLREKYKDFKKAYEEREKSRKQFRNDTKREAQNWISEKMDAWDKENPRPIYLTTTIRGTINV